MSVRGRKLLRRVDRLLQSGRPRLWCP
jgi:hypothetical protein